MEELEKYKLLIGDLLEKLRLEKGYSQTALADIAGVAQSTYRDIEMGKSAPNIMTLIKICSVFDMTLTEFVVQLDGPKNRVIIDDLSPDNKQNILAIANTMKNQQKLADDTRDGLSGLTESGKSDSEIHLKREKRRKKA